MCIKYLNKLNLDWTDLATAHAASKTLITSPCFNQGTVPESMIQDLRKVYLGP